MTLACAKWVYTGELQDLPLWMMQSAVHVMWTIRERIAPMNVQLCETPCPPVVVFCSQGGAIIIFSRWSWSIYRSVNLFRQWFRGIAPCRCHIQPPHTSAECRICLHLDTTNTPKPCFTTLFFTLFLPHFSKRMKHSWSTKYLKVL